MENRERCSDLSSLAMKKSSIAQSNLEIRLWAMRLVITTQLDYGLLKRKLGFFSQLVIAVTDMSFLLGYVLITESI
ncbi:hypothetical protein C0J52_08546 [Blattella germanica]|nr:hypothetical protein C0J52_08546 [Blattella germanica]